jgi:hypothetical protein
VAVSAKFLIMISEVEEFFFREYPKYIEVHRRDVEHYIRDKGGSLLEGPPLRRALDIWHSDLTLNPQIGYEYPVIPKWEPES